MEFTLSYLFIDLSWPRPLSEFTFIRKYRCVRLHGPTALNVQFPACSHKFMLLPFPGRLSAAHPSTAPFPSLPAWTGLTADAAGT